MDSSSDESSSSDEDRDELDLAGPNAKKSKAAMDRELKLAAKTAPPSMTLHTSTGGFNLYKRAVPLVYFCQNAFDKFAKGGQGKSWFKIDWDKLAERGMKAGDWELRDDVKEIVVNPLEDGRSLLEVEIPTKSKKPRTEARRGRIPREDGEGKLDPAESSSDESDGSQLKDIESQSSEEVSGSDDDEPTGKGRSKRKRGERTPGGKRKRKNAATTPSKRRKTTKSSRKKVKETYEAITTQLDPHLLPKDPYERALHLLHVGATPDTLPCRESEFVDVLMRVEEGVEGGGGGCLCESCSTATDETNRAHDQRDRHCWSAGYRQDGDGSCRDQTTESSR
jgi:origin recognition complex subunit 1